jgi:hypothetical protein
MAIPMNGNHSPDAVLQAEIIAALQASQVFADAIGVSLDALSDPSRPRIFNEIVDSFSGARNRGRLPFVEVNVETPNVEHIADDAQTLTLVATIRCHVGGRNKSDAASTTQHACLAALAACRSMTNRAAALGNDSTSDIQAKAWSFYRSATLVVYQTISRTDYDLTTGSRE